jgi:hypothetical protein
MNSVLLVNFLRIVSPSDSFDEVVRELPLHHEAIGFQSIYF